MLLRRGDGRVHYDWTGSRNGETVCLIHGLAADTGMWAEQVVPLADAGFGVLRIDLPGHGGSSTGEDYTLDGLSLWVEETLAALEVGSVHLVGLSLGGIVGQAIALRKKRKLRSLTLCATLVSAPNDPAQAWRQRVRDIRAGAASLDAMADASLARWLSAQFREAHPRRWREIRETAAAVHPQACAGCVELVNTFDLWQRIPAIDTPTFIICGHDDPGSSPALAQRMADAIPGAGWAAIEGALHLPNVEKPQQFNAVLLDWLGKNVP